jgi:hypothetical protein
MRAVNALHHLPVPTYQPCLHAALWHSAAPAVSRSGDGLLIAGIRPQPIERLDGQLRDFSGLDRNGQRHPALAGEHHRQRTGLQTELDRERRLGAFCVIQPLLDDVFCSHDS